MKRLSFSLCVLIVCSFCGSSLRAQQADTASSDTQQSGSSATSTTVPRLVRISGVLRELAGQPVTGTVDVHFAIYKDEADTAAIWEETQTLQLDEHGRYTVLLGATQPDGLPLLLFLSSEARWLGVTAGELPEQPRVLMVSVPYALKASDADTLGGKPASAYVTTDMAHTLGTASTLVQTAIVTPRADAATPDINLPVTGSGATNYLPIWVTGSTLGKSTLYETGGKVGIGNTSPAGTLDVSGGAFIRGTLQLPASGTATATAGAASNTLDLLASAFNSSTSAAVPQLFRWQAQPTGNDTTRPSGTLNLLFASGTGTPAQTGLSIASNGVLTFASGQTFPGTGVGNITGVTAGTGLSGGGTGGIVTLNVNEGVVAFQSDLTNGVNTAESFATGAAATAQANAVAYANDGFLPLSGGALTGGLTGTTANFSGNLQAANFTTSSSDNTGVGFGTFLANTTGFNNTAGGTGALTSNTAGYHNTALGWSALYSNTTGYGNTADGSLALQNNTTGNDNTALGYNALNYNCNGIPTGCTANNNTAVGYSAGGNTSANANTTGSNNTFIGANSGPGTSTQLTNATALGANALVSASNSLVLGGTGANAVNVGIGTATPQYTLDVQGTGNFTGAVTFGKPVTFATGQTLPAGTAVTSVGSGAGLTGGPITSSGTLSIATGGVTNGMLQNPSITVTAGNGLSGGGTISLGGSTTLSLNATYSGLGGTFTGSTSPVVSGTNTANSSYGQLGTTVNGIYPTGVYGNGSADGVVGVTGGTGSTGVFGWSGSGTGGYGVYGVGDTAVDGSSSASNGYALYGANTATTGSAYGVYGVSYSSNGTGVYGANSSNESFGQLGTTINTAGPTYATGVYGGSSAASGYGVMGASSGAGGYGVWGSGAIGVAGSTGTTGGYGVYGWSNSGTGGYGVSGIGDTGVYGANSTNASYGQLGTALFVGDVSYATGVYGNGTGYGVYGGGSTGVYGASPSGTGGTGVMGIGDTGVYGYSSSGNGNAVTAINTGFDGVGIWSSGSVGVIGSSASGEGTGVNGVSATGMGGYGVQGNGDMGVYGIGSNYGVFSQGDFGSTGSKSAVVALPDNRVVELYAMESPENWFEDFGSAQLHDGVGEVALDPTFALTVNTGTGYHVFLTPNGDCAGLYVAQKTATGFQVRELQGGKSNIVFDYRIVAKRRGYEDVRMAQLETDAETVRRIREAVQRRPAQRKRLILHKPPEPTKPPTQPAKLEAPKAPPAIVVPKPPELRTPPARPRLAAPPVAPFPVSPKALEQPKTGAASAEPAAVNPKPSEPTKPTNPAVQPKQGLRPATSATATAKPQPPSEPAKD